MSSTVRTVIAVILIGLITFCAVLIVSKTVGRARVADLTDSSLYSLSNGTKNILAKLNQPITLRLYYSRTAARKGPAQIRLWNNYFHYVHDLLQEYVDLSGGKLKLEIIDPRPFSEEEEDALAYGLKRFQMGKDESFFFGLVALTELGKDKVIKFFEPNRQEFVEYDLSKTISSLAERDKKKIGILSPLPVAGTDMSPYMRQMLQMQGKRPEQSWAIVEHLRQSYQVVSVKVVEGKLTDQVDFLMVVHPKNFTDEQLFAIDQHLMNGGRMIVLVDPQCMADPPQQQQANQMPKASSSNLNKLLKKWGMTSTGTRIVVDRNLAVAAQLRRNASPVKLPTYLNVVDGGFNMEQSITAKLHSVRMLMAGALESEKVDGVEIVPLIHTTADAALWKPVSPYDLWMPDPARIKGVDAQGKQINLAVLMQGKFKSNFPDGIEVVIDETPAQPGAPKPKPDPNKPVKKKKLDAIKESAEGARIIVFSDVDLMSDMMAYQQAFFGMSPAGDNASLVFNAVDYLAGSQDLISIRTRGAYSRPFKVVDQIELEAEEATAVEMEAVNAKIKTYQDELKKLGGGVDSASKQLIENEALTKRRQLELDIRKAQKELRRLQAKRRERVEELGDRLQAWNMIAAPLIILLVAVILAAMRYGKARRYTRRRN